MPSQPVAVLLALLALLALCSCGAPRPFRNHSASPTIHSSNTALALPPSLPQDRVTAATEPVDIESTEFRLDRRDFTDFVEIEPTTVSSAAGDMTTAAIKYKIEHLFEGADLYLKSEGVLTADAQLAPTRGLEHKLRWTLDLLPDRGSRKDYTMTRRQGQELYTSFRREGLLYRNEPELAEVSKLYAEWTLASDQDKPGLLKEARRLWQEIAPGRAFPVDEDTWPELDRATAGLAPWLDETGKWRAWLEFDAGAETDQDFDDVQFVGGAEAKLKLPILGKPLDWFCGWLRGGNQVVKLANLNRGPYLWVGIDAVDASENESRKMITGGVDDDFLRARAGAYYRNELWSSDDGKKTIDLEAEWLLYHELDAPSSIEAADLDTTSFVRVALTYDDFFVEYRDGRQPLDLQGESAVFVGFRFGEVGASNQGR